MSRRAIAWLLAFPLMAAGTITAHALAYRIVVPNPVARADLLSQTGHSYLAFAPVFLGTCAALLVAGLGGAVLRARRRGSDIPAAWQLAILPPLAFAIQEHLERLFASGHFPVHTVTGATFLAGLALQLPFALLAVAVTRVLARVAVALGRVLAATPPTVRALPRSRLLPVSATVPRVAALAFGQPQRGPPAV